MTRAGVVGASGYIGGELLRLLLGHPAVELAAATSTRLAGRRVDGAHPHLRGLTDVRFVAPGELDCDVVFLATPHTTSMRLVPTFLRPGTLVVDLSGDFRLRDPAAFEAHYGVPHAAPDLLPTFVPGLPELHRDRLAVADRVSVGGCMSTAAILALEPLVRAGLVGGPVRVDARTGSSGSGSRGGPGSAHPERSGTLRVYAPTGHRHEAEINQAVGLPVAMTATGVEAVRGVQVLCWAPLADGAGTPAVRAAYRERYAKERFVRVVAAARGPYRLPDPKTLAGSNFCDVGFAVDEERRTVLAVGALDNLVKGGAGNAVQCMNLRLGLPEELGLEFPGLHPI